MPTPDEPRAKHEKTRKNGRHYLGLLGAYLGLIPKKTKNGMPMTEKQKPAGDEPKAEKPTETSRNARAPKRRWSRPKW